VSTRADWFAGTLLLASLGLGAQEPRAAPQDAGKDGRGVKVTPGDDKSGVQAPQEKKDPPFGNYHALLIAIAKYEHQPRLKTPTSDVAQLEQVLRKQYGFTTIDRLLDAQATRVGILTALERYKKLSKNDNLLIYYAGHGTFDEKSGEGYWIPVDARDSKWDWVSNSQIRQVIGQIPAKHTLLVADSCFSGGLTRGAPFQKPDRYVEEVSKKDSCQVIASGGLEEVGDVGRDGLSAFAYYFVKSLASETQPVITTRELFDSVVRRVANDSRQVPQIGTIPPDLGGEFIFARVGKEGLPEATAVPAVRVSGIPLGWSLPANAEERRRPNGDFYYMSLEPDATEMVLVQPGSFPFGGTGRETIAIDRPFLVDKFEVTVERFAKFFPSEPQAGLPYWNQEGYREPQQAMVGVSLVTAQAFAQWAGKQLPDEVLWEYAAGWDALKQELRPFPWGPVFVAADTPAALFPPKVGSCARDISWWGVGGMGSGVQEWCLLPPGDARRLGSIGVMRGASQVGSGRRFRIDAPLTTRVECNVETRANNLGFRCVVPLHR